MMDAALRMRKDLLTLLIVAGIFLAVALPKNVMAQNCGCAQNLCCSRYGYCGTGNDYCGQGCRQGPCFQTPSTGGSVSVSGIVTPQFFNGILNKATGNCPGKGFFKRQAFLDAVNSYPEFGRNGSVDDSKREIAAFFAHATHETGHFCYIEEINKGVYCDANNRQYPCNPSKRYYGRGPLQLTWNYNYGPAGRSNNFDGLNSPETVATDPVISFKTSLWFWKENVRSVLSQGFGATINKINGPLECRGKQPATVQARIDYYRDYCNQFGVAPGNNLYC